MQCVLHHDIKQQLSQALKQFALIVAVMDSTYTYKVETGPEIPTVLSATFGAFHIGATLAAILFGVTNLQAVIYYKKYRNDWWFYKSAVALLWALDALHVALSTQVLYSFLMEFGNLQALFFDSTLWFAPWFTFLAVATSLGTGIFFIYDTYNALPFFDAGELVTKRSTCTFFATLVLSDFIIAIWMCCYLYRSKAATGFSTTTSMLLGLMRLILVSGLATSKSMLAAGSYYVYYFAVFSGLPSGGLYPAKTLH
ncbi:uncharacterized protein ARMOST_01006 [Armillaria ostoyae]|uniref:Uncharacterized protein n=1 Tax=Armillaria ostoyae TaxID=47428 RepID=A0A284QMP7_ARMOS|nr:uncharacterized protein ARMOST_01006 [Armillaria ostoyae]